MTTVAEEKKVSDMTIKELKDIIRDTIAEILDPDYGLELRPEIEESLRESIKEKERGEGMPLEEMKGKLGIQ